MVESVIQNLDVLKDAFSKLIREDAPRYLPFARGWDDKAKERAIEHFEDKDRREAFFKFFKQVQNLYNILSPDAFLRPFIKDYQALASLYGLIRNAYTDRIYVDKELTSKTRELLQQHTESDTFELPGSVHELGADALRKIKKSYVSDTVKVLNLRKVLTEVVIDESPSKPFLISIGERAEIVSEAYENRQLTTQQVLMEFEKLSEEYERASNERDQMGLDENAFAVYKVLNDFKKDITPEHARAVSVLFDQFPDYQWNHHHNSELRTTLYQILIPIVGGKNLIETANALLRLQRI